MDNNLIKDNIISCQKENSSYEIIDNNLVKFDVVAKPSQSWKNQIHYGIIDISNHTSYTVDFYAKAENPTNSTLTFIFQESKSPYREYLRIALIKLNTELTHYILNATTAFNCQFSNGSKTVVTLIVPGSINHYEVQNLMLYKGKYQIDFTEKGEKNLEKIVYPNTYLIKNLPNMAYDLRVFFTETETRTQKTLMNYIKNDLNFKNLYIVDSQIQYGTFFNYVREYENSAY